ncbi:hypothetical protein [Modicisalibacter zincidurans]|uniref:Uncharacterized protein n=1 Tax=Modicisalibacter zincidurans TaxID=1178777 RepID=A0ABP9QZM6_9GAMM|nr:hypothetical protein [Halomonas zincidurans]
MKFIEGVVLATAATVSINAYAFDEADASRLVQRFSEIVACQLPAPDESTSLQYKAVQVRQGMDQADGFGAQYIVYWEGDDGCYGGNGTQRPNFTVVERSGFGSADPVVKTEYTIPELDLVRVTDFYAGKSEGSVHIEGLAYGPDDRQHDPSQPVEYVVELGFSGFKAVSKGN